MPTPGQAAPGQGLCGIVPRIARCGIENSTHLVRRRWVIKHTITWLAGYRCLHRRYERKPDRFPAFTAIAAALTCCRRVSR